MITRPATTAITIENVQSVLVEHDLDKARLLSLYGYFRGEHSILVRTRSTGLPNNRLVNGFPHYIATMTSGFLVGNPVKYSVPDEQRPALEAVIKAYDRADVQSIDNEIALHAAIFGRGVELAYADKQANPKVAALDPVNAFVVYDDTVEHNPLFGVFRIVDATANASTTGQTRKVSVYTDKEVIVWTVSQVEGTAAWTPQETTAHNFGRVPITEYWNNSVAMGDFESVLSLVDAYDTLQSDRVNDKQQAVDGLLVLKGVAGMDTISGDARTPGQRLREDKLLALPDGADAVWLSKALNEEDTDVLRQSLNDSIHKFSLVPDLTDKEFATNASGVAMRYKLFGLEQVTQVKERWFREGLRCRLRLFASFLSRKGASALDPEEVEMTFVRSLPVNETEIATMVQTLAGIVPEELLLAQLPFVEDPKEALQLLRDQQKDAVKRQQEAFGAYPVPPNDDDAEEDEEGM